MKTRSTTAVVTCVLASAAAVLGVQDRANAAINLELRPSFQSVLVGNAVNVELFAVSDSAFDQSFSGVEVIINWDTSYLSLTGDDITGSVMAGFSPRFGASDPYGFNSNTADGDAIWIGWTSFGSPAIATASGSLLTTLNFQALAPTAPDTPISLPFTDAPNGGGPTASTFVVSATNPGENVLGSLSGAVVQITVPSPGTLGLLFGAMVLGGRRRRG